MERKNKETEESGRMIVGRGEKIFPGSEQLLHGTSDADHALPPSVCTVRLLE